MPKSRYERKAPTHEWSQIRPLLKEGSAHRNLKSVRSAREHVHQMYSFGFSGGLRERRFSLKRTLSREVLQRARCILYAHLALQGTLFA